MAIADWDTRRAAARTHSCQYRAGVESMGDVMTHVQFLRIKKLTGKAIIEVAARHNHREILAELGAAQDGHINPARIGFNRVLRGNSTAAAVASHAQTLMDEAGIKAMRKDAVRALEIIFSLPPESPIDAERFFNESAQWAEQYFAAPVISAIVHNDEAAPHCHVLLLPLVDGRMIGSDLMGGRAKLQALQADFHAQVGQRHGLIRKTALTRHSTATRKQAIDLAFDILEANSRLNSASLRVLLEPHMKNPEPLLLAMGLTMPTPAIVKGGFVKMMTKPCKPEKPIGFSKKKPIGFDGSAAPENEPTLSCVGFTNSTSSFSLPNEQPNSASKPAMTEPIINSNADHSSRSARLRETSMTRPAHVSLTEPQVTAVDNVVDDSDGDYVRERDGDQDAKHWNPDTGEFITVGLSAKPSRKALAASSVHAAVMALKDSRERDSARQ